MAHDVDDTILATLVEAAEAEDGAMAFATATRISVAATESEMARFTTWSIRRGEALRLLLLQALALFSASRLHSSRPLHHHAFCGSSHHSASGSDSTAGAP